jgi:ABC-2 type transport system permease protein
LHQHYKNNLKKTISITRTITTMSKISIIIAREYLSRVRKKSFLLTTLVLPIIMAAAFAGIGYIAAKSAKATKFAVVDESGVFKDQLNVDGKKSNFTIFDKTELDSLKINYAAKDFNALLYIKPLFNTKPDTNSINLYTESTLGVEATNSLSDKLNTIYQNKIMADGGMSKIEIDSINNLKIDFKTISADEKSIGSDVASGIGSVTGFLIYLTIFIYGTMVMRGVMEEKTNRIAEIIVSSVKPFELMMGKVIGIGLVGLTQFIIWILFSSILSIVAMSIGASPAAGAMPIGGAAAATQAIQQHPEIIAMAIAKFQSINITKILFCFLFYFLGGYLLYASLFAAVGSLVNEDAQEAQSLTLPITMPIILGFVIAVQAAQDPNSSIAVFGSIFPLTSPIVMMARIGYNPPMWQLLLSMGLLMLTFILTVFLAGKIYRTGILMYGKKLTWKDAIKWIGR